VSWLAGCCGLRRPERADLCLWACGTLLSLAHFAVVFELAIAAPPWQHRRMAFTDLHEIGAMFAEYESTPVRSIEPHERRDETMESIVRRHKYLLSKLRQFRGMTPAEAKERKHQVSMERSRKAYLRAAGMLPCANGTKMDDDRQG
jgi:hypothetical protein